MLKFFDNFSETSISLLSPLSNLKKLGIMWDRRDWSTAHTKSQLSSLINRSPQLRSLSFGYIPDLECPFRPLTLIDILPKKLSSGGGILPLKKFEILTYDLSREDINHIAHHLQSLDYFVYLPYMLHGLESSSRGQPLANQWEYTDIWSSLLQYQIFPKRIWTNATAHPTFMEYMKSCKTMYSLQLTLKGTELVCEFFKDVLPMFEYTLVTLEVRMGERCPHYPTELGAENVDSIALCEELRDLNGE
ncbi:hypothetical protein NP233_g12646 [Leucocoprinus birnbaumii]|uniref:Uncharacterized protein n=1 Tax=Leucocoprinus birnbaumii TaxID=56174 RepID=A0AAD5VEL6_9AGAR|nr:hypothetical protein NP233_g12646 [Leucocoprinus birnbaumii]